ncbi:hypothetical protein DL765_003462 [Monosporascus sp. GIB2]|nr:hypothetical protein DL765_003462 [Monosporascus sp. GIB2]
MSNGGDSLVKAPETSPHTDSKSYQKKFNRNPRFWAIIGTLCVIGILSALENAVVATSPPYIVTQLDLGENYIWVTNVFCLISAAITIVIVILFTLGSGITGGASNAATLIAGRTIQGMGSDGINMIIDVIVSDLVPLRERGNYMAYVLLVYFIGTAIGPYVGGAIVETASWRWVFYINLPYDKEMTFVQKIRRIDYIGNVLLIAATVAVLFVLTYGGTQNAKFIKEPVVPPRLFANRTSATIFALLPSIVVAIPAAVVAVLLLAKFGKYKPLHLIGFGLNTIGLGLFSLLDERSSTAEWVIFQLIAAGGSGFVLNTLLPACQTPLDEQGQAAATATWSFVRSFGNIWGVAIPAGYLQQPVRRAVRSHLRPRRGCHVSRRKGLRVCHCKLYQFVSAGRPIRDSERIKMRTELDIEYGMADGKRKKDVEKNGKLRSEAKTGTAETTE